MGECDMRRWIYIPIIGVGIGELLIFRDMILGGMGIHLISLLAIILIIIFDNLSLEVKNILQSLILIPLLRIISLSIPRLFTGIYPQYLLMCIIILFPIYSVIKNQYISFRKLETNSEMSHIYIFIAILIWSIMMMVGQYVNIVSNMRIVSPDNIYVREEFVSIFLAISLSILLLTLDTKYWNKYVSSTFGMYNNSLLLTFVTIVAHKIIVMTL